MVDPWSWLCTECPTCTCFYPKGHTLTINTCAPTRFTSVALDPWLHQPPSRGAHLCIPPLPCLWLSAQHSREEEAQMSELTGKDSNSQSITFCPRDLSGMSILQKKVYGANLEGLLSWLAEVGWRCLAHSRCVRKPPHLSSLFCVNDPLRLRFLVHQYLKWKRGKVIQIAWLLPLCLLSFLWDTEGNFEIKSSLYKSPW